MTQSTVSVTTDSVHCATICNVEVGTPRMMSAMQVIWLCFLAVLADSIRGQTIVSVTSNSSTSFGSLTSGSIGCLDTMYVTRMPDTTFTAQLERLGCYSLKI